MTELNEKQILWALALKSLPQYFPTSDDALTISNKIHDRFFRPQENQDLLNQFSF
jgi:hypothetical protein